MVSQVKRDTMRACLSCPICDSRQYPPRRHHYLRVPPHLKCIYEKITEEEIEGCPVCHIDLGGTPLDKLKPDHNLQDLRAKIFPLKRRKVKAPEPARRKERSMSSLVVAIPKVSDQAGRKIKTATRKELRDSASLAEKEEAYLLKGDLLESSPNKSTQNKNKDSDEPWDPESYWKTLNILVEVANRTKTLKLSSASQGSGLKSEQASASHKQFQPKVKDHKSKSETTTTPKRLPRTQRKRLATTFGDPGNPPQPDESRAQRQRRNGPVWFSLVASTDQEGKTYLPQIPAKFLRMRDGDVQVSFIQKYLMRKLDLQSESEVEIRCMGEAVVPTLKLQKLVDLWLQRSSKCQKIDAWIGSSAKDYMMVLAYGRKLLECNK